MKKRNIILLSSITSFSLVSIPLISFFSNNPSSISQTNIYLHKQPNIKNLDLRAPSDYIEEPIFYNNFVDATPIFNVRNFDNIQGEENLYASEVSLDTALRLVINNIEDIFGTSIDAQNFKAHLKEGSFNVINFPKDICVIFTLKDIIFANSGSVGEKEYQLILTGFRFSADAELTWLIYTIAAIVPGVSLLIIIFIIVRWKLKKKSDNVNTIVDGEYVVY